MKGEPLSSAFSSDRTLISASAAPHCGASERKAYVPDVVGMSKPSPTPSERKAYVPDVVGMSKSSPTPSERKVYVPDVVAVGSHTPFQEAESFFSLVVVVSWCFEPSQPRRITSGQIFFLSQQPHYFETHLKKGMGVGTPTTYGEECLLYKNRG